MDSLSLLPSRARSVLLSKAQDPPPVHFLLESPMELGRSMRLWCRDAGSGGQANDVSTRFGRRLRLLRQQRRMTQSDMAKRFGIDRSYISEVERGRKSMTLAMLEVIALGMDLSLSKLFEDM